MLTSFLEGVTELRTVEDIEEEGIKKTGKGVTSSTDSPILLNISLDKGIEVEKKSPSLAPPGAI